MSGRFTPRGRDNRGGRGRYGGRDIRGGRGRGRFQGRQGRNTAAPKKLEMKFFPHGIGRETQSVTYDTVKDAIVSYVQRTYKHGQDIAMSLRDLSKMDLTTLAPIRGQSEATETQENQMEQQGLDIMYQAKLEKYLDRKDTLDQNMTKSYALIYDNYCNKIMQNRIEEHPDYEGTIRDDPIELLMKIKVLMHDPIRAKYPFASLTEAILRMLHLKQSEDEILLDYVKRFKQSRDITKSHVGTDILDKFIENTREYQDETDDDAKKKMKDGAFDKWMSYLLLRNSDQGKYGSLLTGLSSQFSMQNNQYPKTVRDATDILSNHKFDKRSTFKGSQRFQRQKRDWNSKKDDDEETHPSTIITSETSFAQSGKPQICYCCGKKGHISPDCPDKNTIQKEDWYIKRAELHMQTENHNEQDDNASTIVDSASHASAHTQRVAWSGLLIAKTATEGESHYNDDQEMGSRLKNWITLDNGSTLSLFSNPELVEDIRKSDKTLVLATNAGVTTSNQEATVPGFGKVYFNEDAIANIFGLSDLKKKYRMTYDSEKEDAFIVHIENKIIKFECSPEGLYQYEVSKTYRKNIKKPNETEKSGESHLIGTVTENRKGYTLRQFERAKEARKLYHIVGTPTMDNFKSLLRMNIIKNCPVTVEDINIAEKIFGPDVSSLKGKSTRRKPNPVRKDLIEIPKELILKHHNIELCMDTMYVNECGMLTAIDRTIKYRSLIPIQTRHHEEYYRALDTILRQYNSAGFVITEIHCDGDYRGMMEKVKDDLGDVKMNFTNAQDHVPEAERNNRTIKERIRAAY